MKVHAKLKKGALKVGASNPAEWIAYRIRGTLFVKSAAYQDGGKYLDLGASHQIYCGPEVIELETLGPVVILEPGEGTEFKETWQIYSEGNWPEAIYSRFQE
jgi:hypothetical protein